MIVILLFRAEYGLFWSAKSVSARAITEWILSEEILLINRYFLAESALSNDNSQFPYSANVFWLDLSVGYPLFFYLRISVKKPFFLTFRIFWKKHTFFALKKYPQMVQSCKIFNPLLCLNPLPLLLYSTF